MHEIRLVIVNLKKGHTRALEPPSTEAAPHGGAMIVYQTEDGRVKVDVRLQDESLWLTQRMMADLFQSSKQNISHHIQAVYEEGELDPGSTVKKYLTVRREGNREVARGIQLLQILRACQKAP